MATKPPDVDSLVSLVGPPTEEDIVKIFEACDAIWLHNGDPKKPHAELTSGKCSNGFFDCLRVLRYPYVTDVLAHVLYDRLIEVFRKEGMKWPDWVIGSAYAAITFSYEVAKVFNATHGFVEKDPEDPKGKKMMWKRMAIPEGAIVLQIEELITTAGTLNEVRRAVDEGNPNPVNWSPILGVIVHRPPQLPVDYGDRRVIALLEREVWAVDPPCPLCKQGSPRLRPKTHWAELTGKA